MQPIFSVSEFNEMVGNHVSLLGQVTVEGELSELKTSQGKWVYATLKDEYASVNLFGTVYQIRNLRSLDVGMQVKVIGVPSLYQKTARFSLNVSEIMPSGEGALRLAFEKLRLELEHEGLFDPSHKRPLPQFPEKIGLLTAKDSQAYQDFVKVSRSRTGGFKILYYPVNVQGAGSVESVLQGLDYFNNHHTVDVIVLTRGGGSLEDLASFNDERVVRAVFASKIPTVCAIGHEGDISLAELVADMRGSTPSNAAELIFREKNAVLREIDYSVKTLESALSTRMGRVEYDVHRSLSTISHHVERSCDEIAYTVQSFIHSVDGVSERINRMNQDIEYQYLSMTRMMTSAVKLVGERIDSVAGKLSLLDPAAVVRRGFSIVTIASGKIVSSVSDLRVGMEVDLTLADGTARSSIMSINKERHDDT